MAVWKNHLLSKRAFPNRAKLCDGGLALKVALVGLELHPQRTQVVECV